ncbi:MAG: class I poly(R)-hydroxyalkanoic acid synthase [Neisseria sp.]|jgi:polyhydroxyalkanoate synthase
MDQFSANENMRQFFSSNDQLMKKVQEFYFGDNPVSTALAKINKEDMKIFFDALAQNPTRMMEMQFKWWQGQMEIYRNVFERSTNKDIEPFAQSEPGDRRFQNELWQDKPNYDLLSQSYLHFSNIVLGMLEDVEGVSDKVRDRLSFFMRQMINALSPGNFMWSNPEVIQQTIEENGANLIRGMDIFQADAKNSGAFLRIRMTPDDAFELGKDLAYTPGSVVFENEIFQLIQYEAKCEETFKTPLLIVPPFINKYYILDLREQNSLVNWAREQGHTVFLMSWRNPDATQAHVSQEDLILSGTVEAANVIEEITGERDINAMGYCIGGTLLAATQAYYVGKRLRNRIKSATYLTTMLDYSEPGGLGVFINEPVISAVEALDEVVGYSDGRQIAVTFSLLRENTLYWNYYIDNYLKGKEPSEFDILYWNSDGTNITPKVHSFVLRDLYLNNDLTQPNKIRVNGVGLNLSRVKTPNFFISCQEDHIASWESTFMGSNLLGGESTLVMGESGHVAGIVNPPSKDKYGYYTNAAKYENGKDWLATAVYTKRSWWLAWQEWVEAYAGEKVPARAVGSEANPVIEAAPGRYVKVSCFKI